MSEGPTLDSWHRIGARFRQQGMSLDEIVDAADAMVEGFIETGINIPPPAPELESAPREPLLKEGPFR